MLDAEFGRFITRLLLWVGNPRAGTQAASSEIDVARKELSSIWHRLIHINYRLSFSIAGGVVGGLIGLVYLCFSKLLNHYDLLLADLFEFCVWYTIFTLALPIIKVLYDFVRVLLMFAFCGAEIRDRMTVRQHQKT